jgi:hypothetical protein
MAPEASRPGTGDVPDFTAPYEADYQQGSHMTPRMAYWLWETCLYLADTWRENRDDPESLLEFLPPVARPFAKVSGSTNSPMGSTHWRHGSPKAREIRRNSPPALVRRWHCTSSSTSPKHTSRTGSSALTTPQRHPCPITATPTATSTRCATCCSGTTTS